MLTCRIIPCLDVSDGRVVKGVNFVNLTDAGDPVACAGAYDKAGADELCFLDITASHEGRDILLEKVRETAVMCFMPLTVGGGVRNIADIRALLNNGADKVAINTEAVRNPDFVAKAAEKYGSQCITVAIDAKRVVENNKTKFEIFTHGGSRASGIDAIQFAEKMQQLGAGEILLTSMDRDGTRSGFDLELTKSISEKLQIPIIASGGGGELKHFLEAVTIGKADAVLAASVFHFGTFSIQQVKQYMQSAGIDIRITNQPQ